MAQRRGPERVLVWPIALLAVALVYAIIYDPHVALRCIHRLVLGATPRDVEHTPDLSRIVHHRILSHEELKLDEKHGRLITIGDIHGMNHSLHSLLEELEYDPKKDKLIHHGDFLTKGPGSNAVLSWMSSNNITGVRGNQDQVVFEWRSWLNWIESIEGGSKWLARVEKRFRKAREEDEDVSKSEWIEKQRKKAKKNGEKVWWNRLPEGWKLFGEHFHVAQHMSDADYEYLASLPLILHAPSIHSYFVHGGLLPYKLLPTRPYATSQPLGHVPPHDGHADEDELRRMQEEAILNIPENQVPWNVLNIRSVKRGRHVSRENFDGKPWSNIWTATMKRCAGYGVHLNSNAPTTQNEDRSSSRAQAIMQALEQESDVDAEQATLPCMPSMIVYAHAATRGRDVKRWSIGIDTGCVYGQRLTAMVLGARNKDFPAYAIEDGKRDDEDPEIDSDHPAALRVRSVKYGDNGKAHLVSVRCHQK